ncbi:MAG: right-handed parallel beta-helix repeat-containing protein [Thermoproteota archaeon]
MVGLDHPNILYVSQNDSKAKFHSISQAAQKATEGDQIIVGPGTYSFKTTHEHFPIYIPPLCQLIGSGVGTCKIDGGGALQISTRPLDPYQSLILLGDKTSLTGFTISNSGGNAISNEQGAKILVTKNTIENNGQHGLLVFGTDKAVVQNNYFKNNGTKKAGIGTPRWENVAKQGHHIFIEGKPHVRNDAIIIGNKLEKTFADGIDIEVFDQPDGIEMNVHIIENIISECGRYGCCMAGSYGPSNSNVFIEIRNNHILKTAETAIDAEAAISLIRNTIHNSNLHVNIIDNKIDTCDCGINLFGAFSPSKYSHARYNVMGNEISDTKRYGIRAVGGVGMDEWPVSDTICQAVIANNKISDTGKEPIFVQGGINIGKKRGEKYVTNNVVFLTLFGNNVTNNEIVVNDGLPTNQVIVFDDSQPHRRKKAIVPYDEP